MWSSLLRRSQTLGSGIITVAWDPVHLRHGNTSAWTSNNDFTHFGCALTVLSLWEHSLEPRSKTLSPRAKAWDSLKKSQQWTEPKASRVQSLLDAQICKSSFIIFFIFFNLLLWTFVASADSAEELQIKEVNGGREIKRGILANQGGKMESRKQQLGQIQRNHSSDKKADKRIALCRGERVINYRLYVSGRPVESAATPATWSCTSESAFKIL